MKKSAAKKIAKVAVKKSARKAMPKKVSRRKISPEQALANTRQLLEAKHEHDRQPQPWQQLDPQHGHVPGPGYQSEGAAAKAEELHAGESRMQAIQGSISSQDRHSQGKRDNR
ncbi:MAG TPA: hypothetical protein VIT66_03085 [Lysobacter sp.]